MIFEIGLGLFFMAVYLLNIWGCISLIRGLREAVRGNDKLSAFGFVCILLLLLSLPLMLTGALKELYF